ncbi:MAG: prepilin-type N-terminal cleavage/methylation domain-containing protein [Armatimonadetes bacterium]|nr:prepilin-type N-terminal cleavage/methylation domain-containing protein [Armatimonadota bacterium]
MRRQQGFTLIEMIVATMLLVLGAVAALACYSTGLRATRAAEDYTMARLLAQQKLSELEAADPARLLQAGAAQQGVFGPQAPDFRWQARILKTDIPRLYRAQLTLFWGEPGRERRAEFETFLLSARSQNDEKSAGNSRE